MTATSMPTRPSVWSEMFTWNGRANRGRYWLTALLWCLVLAPIWISFVLAWGPEVILRVNIFLFYAISFVVGLPVLFVSIRRLHDRNKSGHWLWLFWGATNVFNAASQYLQMRNGTNDPVALALVVPSIIISIWAFVELGCLRGTAGPNRFGPDPLQGLSA